MSTSAKTIASATARLGPDIANRLRETVAEFNDLILDEEDRLSVLATALAAIAASRHARHTPIYLEAVRTWALEISAGSAPPVHRATPSDGGLVEDGAELLIAGLDLLLGDTATDGTRLPDRLIVELAFLAQLLGRHDANGIHRTLMAVTAALADEDYRPGRAVSVPVGDLGVPLGRDVPLAMVAPRGVA